MNIVEMRWACSVYPYVVIAYPISDGMDYLEKIKMDGDPRYIAIRNTAWFDFVKLGLMFGWQPEGALLQDKEYIYRFLQDGMELEDSYHPLKLAEFKLILKEDSAGWADALELAFTQLQAGTLEFAFKPGYTILGEHMTPKEFANANNPTDLKRMREFIDFLQKGSFEFYYDD